VIDKLSTETALPTCSARAVDVGDGEFVDVGIFSVGGSTSGTKVQVKDIIINKIIEEIYSQVF
jgi:hypothetical protein